jgi:hypothetical protein
MYSDFKKIQSTQFHLCTYFHNTYAREIFISID